MFVKIVIVLFLLVIIYTLFSSFYYLAKDKGEGDRVVRRLSWRIGLSLLLVLSLYGAYKMGWVEPGGRPPVQYGTSAPDDGG